VALVLVVPGPNRRDRDSARVVGALVSALRAVRGVVPKAAEIQIFEPDEYYGRPQSSAAAGRKEAGELTGELLRGWWSNAYCRGEEAPVVEPPEAARAEQELATTAFFAADQGSALWEAEALARYLTDQKLRHELRDAASAAVQADTRVVVGHGIGALIAYEALCVVGESANVTFVTLGGALSGPAEVFQRTEPRPRHEQGHWPPAVRHWTNIVAHSDLTATNVPELTERFGQGIDDQVLALTLTQGDIYKYLMDQATGRAVATGLRDW
jgi:hypothetical protein